MENTTLDALQKITETEANVLLLNEYKGVPICHEARFKRQAEDAATVIVHPHQAVCLFLGGETVLQCQKLSLALKAKATVISLHNRSVKLTDFAVIPYTSEGRETPRLKPHTVAFASLRMEGLQLTGAVANVSSTGLRLKLPVDLAEAEPLRPFQASAPARIRVQLTGMPAPADFSGKLIYARLENQAISVGIDLSGDEQARAALGVYVAQQQPTVLPELDRIYEKLIALACEPL